jgi:hypothetical protein
VVVSLTPLPKRRREAAKGRTLMLLHPHWRRQITGDAPGLDHPRQLSEEELIGVGVIADMIRLSVGPERLDARLWDIDHALKKAVGS